MKLGVDRARCGQRRVGDGSSVAVSDSPGRRSAPEELQQDALHLSGRPDRSVEHREFSIGRSAKVVAAVQPPVEVALNELEEKCSVGERGVELQRARSELHRRVRHRHVVASEQPAKDDTAGRVVVDPRRDC